MQNIFRRKIYKQLVEWKRHSKGTSALLVEGPRRVGKSTLVEEFAKKEYESYILIDFNKASKEMHELFEDLTDLDFIFLRLQQAYRKKLAVRKSLIIFDEVQKCPNARQAIKYLVQDGRYDYIETGSLISIKKNTESITIPSEEDRIQMHPMDYEEFRWALDDEATIPLLQQFWDKKIPFKHALRQVQRDFRTYMLVGGMPQAVNTYLETNNLQEVDATKRKIIQLYDDDFLKIDPSGTVSKLFTSIPASLSRQNSRYVPYSIIGNVRESRLYELLRNLEDSKTVNFAYHVNDPNSGMPLSTNYDTFKLFTADTGLFVTLAFWDKNYTENIIYEKLLSDKLSANLGYVYENLVAQMLVAKGHKLFYHTWKKDEKHYYEIDFLITQGFKISPIEVKSSGYRAHTSLDEFSKRYSSRIHNKYLVYAKDLGKDGDTLLVPTMMVGFL